MLVYFDGGRLCMNIKIDKDEIKKYAALVVVSGALVTGLAMDINCDMTNHHSHDCLKSKVVNFIDSKENGVSVGMQHRLNEIKKSESVADAYYGDIMVDEYEYKAAKEYRHGSDITFVAPSGYCLEGTYCRSIEPIGQKNLGVGIVIKYKDGHVKRIILDSNNDAKNFEFDYPSGKKFVTTATYKEVVFYTEAKREYCNGELVGYSTDVSSVLVEENGKMLSKYTVLTLKK